MFPPSFDVVIYKQFNYDLNHLNEENLIDHYLQFGKSEGRICSTVDSRKSLVDIILDANKNIKCLEIGPFDCPVLKGRNVKYFDVLSQKDLRNRYYKCERNSTVDNMNNYTIATNFAKLPQNGKFTDPHDNVTLLHNNHISLKTFHGTKDVEIYNALIGVFAYELFLYNALMTSI